MKLYSSNESYKLYQGDMLDMLEAIEPNSIDSVITDPPYGLTSITKRFGKENSAECQYGKDGSFARLSRGFMGKEWDGSGIEYNVDTWKKCYEVLKPGGYLLAFGGSRTFHRIACAIEDAGFEIRDTIMWLYGCYSADTQVLTNQGWKYFYELDKTEKILQWNKDTNELTWLQPLNYFEYDIKDELIHYKNRHTDQLITKNHNVVCKVCKRRKQKEGFDFYKAEDIKKSWIIDFPLAGELKDGLHNDNAYIIGWWLTDAWKHKDDKACMFSQSKPKTLEKLRNYFNANNINYSEYTKKVKNIMHHQEHSFYVTGDLAKYLLTNYNDREMTWDFLTWDYDSRLKLIEGLIDGDGSDRKGQYSNVFWSKKKDRLDIFQALCISLNMRSHIDYNKGCVYFNEKHNTTQIQTRHHQPLEKYEGKVYCLETETGAFVVRRNGKAFISGNSGFPKSMNIGLAIDKKNGIESIDTEIKIPKATNEWQGWGTALKPSFEPIIIARKPFKGSLVDNVIKNGVGGINIDECRVGMSEDDKQQYYDKQKSFEKTYQNKESIYEGNSLQKSKTSFYDINTLTKKTLNQGRFPANTILTYDDTDFEEVCGGFPNTKTGSIKPHKNKANAIVNKMTSENITSSFNGDSGSASRYFYNAKASKKDRDEGLDDFNQEKVNDGRNTPIDNAFQRGETLRKNTHPTVKPTELMQYLVRLVTPNGGTILDPFNGSGSTGKAVMYENKERNKNYKYVGIELTEEYLPISKARIEYVCNLIDDEEKKDKQLTIFDLESEV